MDSRTDTKNAQRLAKNSLALGIRYAAAAISKFLIVVVIARWRGVEEVGDFTYVTTFTLALSFLNNLGLGLLLTREIAAARERVREYVGNALTLCLGLGILSVAATGGIAAALGSSNLIVNAVLLAALAMAIETLNNMFYAAFSGYERMELTTVALVIQELAFLVIGAVILYIRLPFLWLFVTFVVSRFVGLISGAWLYWRLWSRPQLLFDPATMKFLGHKTLPYALNVALSPVFARVDVLLLSHFEGNTAVGYYEVASTLFYRLSVLARMLNLALMPLVAREYSTRGPHVVRYVKAAVKYQAIIALPITALGWVLGDKIVMYIYGPEFAPSVLPLQLMASAILLRFIDNTLATTLTGVDLQGRRTLAVTVMAAFNIGINIFVLPRYSFMGAAVTSILTEVGFFVLLWTFVRSRLPNPIEIKMLLKPALASGVMVLPLWLGHSWPLLALLPLGVLVYGVAAIGLRVLTPQEVGLLLKAGRLWHLLPPHLQSRLAPSASAPE